MDKAHRLFVGAASRSPSGDSPEASAQDSDAKKASACPVVGSSSSSSAAKSSGCPVVGESGVNPLNNMPRGDDGGAVGAASELGRERIVSSIPRAASEDPPKHQEGTPEEKWVYPSEQMFYNAMKRKGWNPDEQDMGTVVKIHNAVNERAWHMILQWEASLPGSCEEQPRLRRFTGRPQEYSPKARLLNFMGYKLPFDRHDWYIERCGSVKRYVIDFYNAPPSPQSPVAMHLDVRPALDSPSAALHRLYMQWRHVTGM
uniref:Holocytochrome c-type synthase n=1 Tax=Tetraselmis chuii TaxID=63592 RepID=A0A7S1T7U5_9CHLO|mmetsp:Transcript_7840/g.14080  ORF Transcript_7840/g.14080 Transcript_7840/m.14080 type:complete len:258 (+) Transcript_7840:138-911(+)